MSLFGKLRSIFSGSQGSASDGKKKPQHSFIKYDADPNEFWEIVGELGDGAFGKVYKTRHKVQQIFAALKQVDINDETELEDYSVEIDILNQCRHKNIVGLHEAYYFGGKLWMFIEFCGGGALDGIMVELEKPLTEPQIRYVCREMCEALEFLHQHFVIHRDLKAGNVLLTCEGEVKLADFGVSAKNSSYRQKRDTFIGTPYWMAPEVILCETIKDSPYDFKADIWSFGITLIEFAQIEPPNHEMHPMRVLIKIQKSESPTLKRPSQWSKEFNDFIAKCLAKDPDQRPTAGDLLQHPFIRDVKNGQAIMELVSEANAEIILEEKDLDEDEGEGLDSTAATADDSDTASLTSGSNIPKSNEDDISDVSPVSGDTGKVPLPTITIDVSGDKKTVEPEKSSSAEDASPDAEEPVVLRKKKTPPDSEKASNPEAESTIAKTGQKKYRTLTKTRKFVVNGEVVMSTVSKVIAPGSAADKKQQEHQLWKADLRELKLLHKLEKKQLQDMEIRNLAAIEEQNRKFETDNAILVRNTENSLDQLNKQHKQQTDKMADNHLSENRNTQRKTKQDQDKELRTFNESLKQELKLLKQEVDLMPKEVRKDVFQRRKREKEVEHAEKERKFIEQQKESMDRIMRRVAEAQKEKKALSERQFLQLKQQTIRARETSLWDAEITQLKDRYRLNVQQLDAKFILKKQLMMVRQAKELEQVQRINASKEDELSQCHLVENKRLPKIMKNEGKTRALMFKQSLRISIVGLTADQEKEKLKQFEETEKNRLKEEETRLRKKHKRQMAELKAKNDSVVKELEQVHTEKKKMLEDNENQKRKELEQEFNAKIKTVIDEQGPKKEVLEETFAKEVADNEKFYSNGTSVDQESTKVSGYGVSQTKSGQVPTVHTNDKELSKNSPQTTRKVDTLAPHPEETKRLSKASPQNTRKVEEPVPSPETTKQVSKPSPLSTKKIEVSALSAEDTKQASKLSPLSTKKIEVPATSVDDTKRASKVSPLSNKKFEVPAASVDDTKQVSKVSPLSTKKIEAAPSIPPPEVVSSSTISATCLTKTAKADSEVLHVADSHRIDDKIPAPSIKADSVLEATVPISAVIPDSEHQEQKVAINVPPCNAETLHTKEETAVVSSVPSEPPVQLEAEVSVVTQAGLVPDSSKQGELHDDPVLDEPRRELDDNQVTSSDVDAVDMTEKPVNSLPEEIASLPLDEEITMVESVEVCDVDLPAENLVDLVLESKPELLMLHSSEKLPEQSSTAVVQDLCSDSSDQLSSKAELQAVKQEAEVCVDAQGDLVLESPQAKGAEHAIDFELLSHQKENVECSEPVQPDVQSFNMGNDDVGLKTDQKSELSIHLTDSQLEPSDSSSVVDRPDCGISAEFNNDGASGDKAHFSHDVDKALPASTDEALNETSTGNKMVESVDCKSLQSSSEVLDSVKDETANATHEITETVASVIEESSSLCDATEPKQENVEASLDCDEHSHEKRDVESNLAGGSDSCGKSDAKDVEVSHSEGLNEFASDIIENRSKEDKPESCQDLEGFAYGENDDEEKRSKSPSRESEPHSESNDKNDESVINEKASVEAGNSDSLKTETEEDQAENKGTGKDQ